MSRFPTTTIQPLPSLGDQRHRSCTALNHAGDLLLEATTTLSPPVIEAHAPTTRKFGDEGGRPSSSLRYPPTTVLSESESDQVRRPSYSIEQPSSPKVDTSRESIFSASQIVLRHSSGVQSESCHLCVKAQDFTWSASSCLLAPWIRISCNGHTSLTASTRPPCALSTFLMEGGLER